MVAGLTEGIFTMRVGVASVVVAAVAAVAGLAAPPGRAAFEAEADPVKFGRGSEDVIRVGVVGTAERGGVAVGLAPAAEEAGAGAAAGANRVLRLALVVAISVFAAFAGGCAVLPAVAPVVPAPPTLRPASGARFSIRERKTKRKMKIQLSQRNFFEFSRR